MKPYLLKFFAAGIAGLTLCSPALAQKQHRLTADESVQYALSNTVQVKNNLLNIQIQQQTNREITSAAFPQLNGSFNYTNYLEVPTNLLPGELAGQPGTFIPVQFGVKHNLNYGIEVQQLLFDGQVFVGLQARKTSIDYSQKIVEVTQEQIKSNVYKVYYQLLAGRQQVSTLDTNIARMEKVLNDTREIYKNGFAEKLDVDKAEVTLTNLRTEKIKVENRLVTALQGLKMLMGMPVTDELVLTDTLINEHLKADVLELGYNYTDRKEYQQIQLQERLGEFNIKRYKLTYIPTVSANFNYNRNAFRREFNFFKNDQPWFNASFFGFRIAAPIFDGFARDARIRRARLELQQAQNLRENLKLSIDNEIEQARVNFRSAVVSMDFQQKNRQLAETVFNQTKLKYDQGLGSNLEITNAQAELTAAQNNYYAALYDAIVARIDFLRATGKL